MYITNKRCTPAGPFSAPLVVTMRSMAPDQAVRAVQVATRFHLTHGAPVHLGDPEKSVSTIWPHRILAIR